MSEPTPRALVFVELVGAAERWARLGEAFRPALTEALGRARAAAAEAGGSEVKELGEGLMLCFDAPADVARFAARLHRGAADPAAPRLRAGGHWGPSLQVAGPHGVDYLGPTVNKAARITAATPPGAFWVSEELASALSDAVARRPVGSWPLRGLEGAHALWALGGAGAEPPRGNLGPRADRWVGRAHELELLQRSIVEGQRRWVLVGPGGVGKTRLACELAAALPGLGAAWIADLSGVTETEGLLRALGGALDLTLEPDGAAQVRRVMAAAGAALLVLDDADRLDAAALALVAGLAETAPQAIVILTRRAVAALPGWRALTVEPLPAQDAAALLLDRAGLQGEDEAVIAALVQALDGLPLAIELAAARARALPLREIAARLDQRFRLLGARGGDRGSRHGTLRACLDASWEQLTPEQRLALARLAVFPGGAARMLVRPVLGPEADALLGALQDHSLLRADPRDGRVAMLVSVSEYAALQLHPDERASALSRLDAFLVDLCSDARIDQTLGPLGEESLRPLLLDLDTLVAATRRLLSADRAEDAARVGLLVSHVVKLRGPYALSVGLLAEVLDRGPLAPGLRARVLTARGPALGASAEAEAARDALASALALFEAEGDQGRCAEVLSLLADQRSSLGDTAGAEHDARRAVALATGLGDPVREAQAQANLGLQLHRSSQHAAALPHLEQALRLQREIGHRRWQASTLNNLGRVLHRLGRAEEAHATLEQALALSREIGFRRVESAILSSMSALARDEGRVEEAVALLRQMLALARQMGHRAHERAALQGLAIAGVDADAPERA